MSSLEVWLIIILVLGVIASNLAVLKYSNKFKMTQFGKPHHKPEVKNQGANDKHGKDSLNKADSDKASPDKAIADKASADKTSADENSH
ncbi:DUF2897 domain-containing protein [Shewanella loihica]|uniref:DUF2897 family protein n=1 Tax=Shewanella loihica (strain ATCC BAA-1088 / PV-4) TaxID=323850 RepID=A3QE23_SHELP|nr:MULTISPECIES: DUF2897 family protein [Shewanella]ABO23721.1 conserved hypothetical protein [Shewanella loihica PV-4]TVP16214.1 hypothetical protein AYI87_01980 [Shewanella sp. KCT]